MSFAIYTEYAFDADKNLTGLKTTLGTEVLADNHYAYDPNGNRTEKRQISGTTRYTYDALNQLNKVQYPSYAEELYYDRAGNRTRRTAKGVEELYKYDPRNRLTEYTKEGVTTQFTYDNAGNLLKDDKAKYTYDAFNRTEKVETFDGHVQINRYDAEGLRHEMEEDGRLVQFIFRGDEVIAEEKDSSVIRYIRGYDLIASDAESARTYYHYASDEMSSITHIVGAEQILNHYEYDAWGNATVCEETVENRFRFNGQQYDPITQQYYLRARFYNPVIARFTQEDTYRGDGLNLYAYCRNNPVFYVDPSGHWCDKKEKVFKDLMKERGITEADLANDPELKLRMMAEAANQVKSKSITLDSTPELPGSMIEKLLLLPDSVEGGTPTIKSQIQGLKSKLPQQLLDYGWQDITNPRMAANTTSLDLYNPKTGLKIRFDKGVEGAYGFEGMDHYHIYNNNYTNKKVDFYFDIEGNTVGKGSKASHIIIDGED